MPIVEFGSNAPQAVKRWSASVERETLLGMSLKGMIGRKRGSAFRLMTDLDKNPGDEIKYDLLTQGRGNGVNGDAKLEGYEEDLTYLQDVLRVNQKRYGVAYRRMTQQRTLHDLREDAKSDISGWGSWFFEGALFAHLAGTAGDSNESVEGALGATTGETDFAGNLVGIDASTTIDAGHLVDASAGPMTLDAIDDMVAKAKIQNPRIPAIMINGSSKYVLYMHPLAVRGLQRDDSAIRSWAAIQERAGVNGKGNPMYTGALGEYNGVILRESEHVPRVGDVCHNIFVGAGAGCIAFGNAWEQTSRLSAGGGSAFKITEQLDDHDNRKSMGMATITGIKRAMYDGKAFGNGVITTTDVEPA